MQIQLSEKHQLEDMIGASAAMRALYEKIRLVADTRSTVLVTGESGTGKELVARSIHHLSPRKNEAFIPVNCAVIPESLVESQLFGHEKGAFTGATDRKQGFFEAARKGTLFIDEMGELQLGLQANCASRPSWYFLTAEESQGPNQMAVDRLVPGRRNKSLQWSGGSGRS